MPNFNYWQKIELGLSPQDGTGRLSVADWWLTIVDTDFGVVAAAAAPATTRVSAKMRIASFIAASPYKI